MGKVAVLAKYIKSNGSIDGLCTEAYHDRTLTDQQLLVRWYAHAVNIRSDQGMGWTSRRNDVRELQERPIS